MGKNDLVNINGDVLCMIYGCRKHTELIKNGNGILLCKYHYSLNAYSVLKGKAYSHMIYDHRMNPYCHATGCQQIKHLKNIHGGLFCRYHEIQLTMLRCCLIQTKNTVLEWYFRQYEIEFRKLAHRGHMQYQLYIELK